jgi:RNA polymerase sigma-70 factor (ECF subfamily)
MNMVLRTSELPLADEPEALAFEQVYETNFAFAWRMLRRMGVHAANVSDATQDVFVIVSRRLSELTSAAHARSFVYGTVVRVAHEYRRVQKRAAPLGDVAPEPLEADFRNAQRGLELARDVELLDRLLSTLDPEKREVFVLVELDQLTVPEIAELTGHNANTIYSRLRAARIAFDSALSLHRARTKSQP